MSADDLAVPDPAGPARPPSPHFYRQGLHGPAQPPTPHFYRQGPGQPGSPSPHFYRRALGQPGPPKSLTFIDRARPAQPLKSIGQTLTSISQARRRNPGVTPASVTPRSTGTATPYFPGLGPTLFGKPSCSSASARPKPAMTSTMLAPNDIQRAAATKMEGSLPFMP